MLRGRRNLRPLDRIDCWADWDPRDRHAAAHHSQFDQGRNLAGRAQSSALEWRQPWNVQRKVLCDDGSLRSEWRARLLRAERWVEPVALCGAISISPMRTAEYSGQASA